jgi:preprotein translocase subunit SecD
MTTQNSLLKIITLIGLLIISLLYAWPNVYREYPVVEISKGTDESLTILQSKIRQTLDEQHLIYQTIDILDDHVQVVCHHTDEQLKVKDALQKSLNNDQYTIALNLVSSMPNWMKKMGAQPMKLGLDLKGGVHFLLDVDMQTVLKRQYEDQKKSIAETLKVNKLFYSGMRLQGSQAILIRLRNPEQADKAIELLTASYPQYLTTYDKFHGWLQMKIGVTALHELRQATLDQTMSILRHRVNELGVAEAVVQQQGEQRIAVDLPGIQDAARAKSILGGTATLEFRLVDDTHDPVLVQKTGVVPADCLLFSLDGRPILLKKEIVLNGDAIASASSSYDQQSAQPSVSIQLNANADAQFTSVTRNHVGHRMAIVYVETKAEEINVNAQLQRIIKRHERVISAPVIQSALGKQFQITGLRDTNEATRLAILLRTGALPTSIFPVEEKTIGPSLGQENIHAGMMSLMVGMLVVLVLMLVYYRLFGFIADMALLLNLVFLVALLSIIGATLTLPGIAGIVLTLGMAVDANVLINERIREELRLGLSVPAAIRAGYERAFATILDANVTTFIVGLILFSLGSGPVRGFAITLCLGLLTSMLSGVTYSRAMVNAIYGDRKVKKISIGI